ncbi:MAG: PKD domain-containing protein [Flavobacteriales bacterium]|jgi:gliding motility-associated-like protein|nr:PKD domain-containing protein [Flavobacteriales bacterium]
MKRWYVMMVALGSLGWMPAASHAAHIIGGELYYDHLGGSQYQLFLTLYRDCTPGNTGFDAQATIGVFGVNGNLVGYYNAPYTGEQPVDIVVDNPCLTAPPNLCLRSTTYTVTVNLPPTPGGYTASYQRCCRLPAITNIIDPGAQGITCTARIPGQPNAANNSARFSSYPPVVLCVGELTTFDHSATDPDADSLAYKFCTPFHGGTQFNPAPQPSAPPYTTVPWAAGYNVGNQINSAPPMAIDPVSGLLTVTPVQQGYYVVGVCVEEYRNGTLINTDLRDFMFAVVVCDPSIEAIVADQTAEMGCNGLTQEFINESINGGFWHWDFGDPSTDQDTSSVENPTWTYPGPGSYEVMLVANPGWPCADTSYATYVVQEPVDVAFASPPPGCGTTVVQLAATGNFGDGALIEWDLGAATAPPLAQGEQVTATFQPLGEQPVTVTVNEGACTATYTGTVAVHPQVVADFAPQAIFCESLTVAPENLTTGTTDFAWDFGDPGTTADVSTLANPTWTYADPGTYTITLVAAPNSPCPDTTTQVFQMHTEIFPHFERPPIACPGDEVHFIATGNLSAMAQIDWDFGAAGTPAQGTHLMSSSTFDAVGTHPVTVTIVEHGCTGTYTDSVVVHPFPVAHFTNESLACVGSAFAFTDGSQALTPLHHLWYFGDGTTATASDPVHTYLAPGSYDVALVVATDSGCVATDSLMLTHQVVVHPLPQPGFTIHPPVVNIYAADIAVQDHSIGATEWAYWIENSTYSVAEPHHAFSEGGYFTVVQEVTSAHGCTDTISRTVFVRGHVFYAPNAFTPDGDDLNETWLPVVRGARHYELWVHDRWGRLVFHTRDPLAGWDGDGQAPGVYTYQARIKEWGTHAEEYVGHFTLLR